MPENAPDSGKPAGDWRAQFGELAAAGVAACTATLAAHLTTRAIIAYGPVAGFDRSAFLPSAEFTATRDLRIYVACCAAAVLAALGGASVTQWLISRIHGRAQAAVAVVTAAAVVWVCVGALVWFLFRRYSGRPAFVESPIRFSTRWKLGLLVVPPILAVGSLGTTALRNRVPRVPGWLRRLSLWDVVVPIIIILVVFVFDLPRIIGHAFALDGLHHLDYFFMGPAVSFSHGRALGTETYSQYGVAWPMLFGLLAPVYKLSYAGSLQVLILYGCCYLIGLYLLLRLLKLSPAWAMAGTLLSMYLILFKGTFPDEATIWRFPSSTMIRSPMDVWCFMAVLVFVRMHRWLGAGTAGILCAMALLFELDTGIYLTAACVLWFALWALSEARLTKKAFWRRAATIAGASILVYILALVIASRGTIFSALFWRGYLEAILSYSGGFGAIPMANMGFSRDTLMFVISIAMLLATSAYCAACTIKRSATPEIVTLGLVSTFGIANLFLFVNRSHPFNYYHVVIPVVITGVCIAGLVGRRLERMLESSSARRFWRVAGLLPLAYIPLALTTLVVAKYAVVQSASYTGRWYPARVYPSLWKAALGEKRSNVSPLAPELPDILKYGYDQRDAPTIRQVLARLESLRTDGKSVAIIYDRDTMYYLAAGLCPWFRYCPFLRSIVTHEALARMVTDFVAQPPDYALIPTTAPPRAPEAWLAFRKALEVNFDPEAPAGHFQVWKSRKPQNPAGGARDSM